MNERDLLQFRLWTAAFARHVHAIAKAKGFYDHPREFGTSIALIHSELSEALEARRKADPATNDEVKREIGEELADAVIRIFDLAESEGIEIGEELVAKSEVNKNRPLKHGKEF